MVEQGDIVLRKESSLKPSPWLETASQVHEEMSTFLFDTGFGCCVLNNN